MGNDHLPQNWVRTTLGEVTLINSTAVELKHLPDELPVTFVPMAAVEEENGTIASPVLSKLANVRKGHTRFKENDVIFARITPCMENGKVAICRGLANGLGFGSTEFHVIQPKGGVLPEYVYHFLRQRAFRTQAAEHMTGTVGQRRVPAEYMRSVAFPLAPTNEQARIVTKVETLLPDVRTARQALQKVPDLMKQFRHSVLVRAFKGELTERDASKESAELLVQRIRMEHPKEKVRATFLDASDTDNRPDLRKGWAWCSLWELGSWLGGGTPSKNRHEFWSNGVVPWVTPKDMKRECIVDSKDHITTNAVKAARLRQIPPGSILIVVRGMILARTIPVALNDAPVTINQDMKALTPYIEEMSAYLFRYVQSRVPDLLQRTKSSTHGTKRLEFATLQTLMVPVAPLDEQRRIVSKISDLFMETTIIEDSVTSAIGNSEAQEQAILMKAFRGELTPQDSNDEPATVLLERMKNQDTKRQGGKGVRTSRR